MPTNPNNPPRHDEVSPRDATLGTIWWGGVLVVVVLAIAIRVANVWYTTDVPTARYLIGDAAGYYQWSLRIAAGDWIGDKAFYQAPLYPYVLAVWHVLGAQSITAIRILQAVCGAAACGLLCIAASRMFCSRIGFLSGLMLALYAPAIHFDGIIQKASLDCLLVCAMLACIAILQNRHSLVRCALLGAAVSLLCLTRENAMAWHLVLVAWIAWWGRAGETSKQDQRRGAGIAARNVLVYVLGAAGVLLPVGLRNHYVQGEFLLTTSQAGPNFYIGNNANADGRYQPLVRGHETPQFEQRDATELAEQSTGRNLTPREVSRFWMSRAWSDIASHPIQWLALTGKKMLLTWNQYEIADGESIAIYRRHSPALNGLHAVWHFGVLAPLAVLGIALTWDPRRLWVLYALIVTMTITVAAFYVLARYRYPLVPLLIPFAAAGCIEMWRKRRQAQTLVLPLALALPTALVANWSTPSEKRLDALAEMNAGVALAQAGEIEDATEYFALAVSGHPTSAEANFNLATALAVQKKFTDAIPYYEKTLQMEPDLAGVHYNLGVAFEQTGSRQEALKHYELALQQDATDAQARAALDRLRS